MKTVVRYFRQHSKSTLIRLAIITFICLVIVTLSARGVTDTYNRYKAYDMSDPYYEYEWHVDPGLPVFAVIVALLCTFLPMAELSIFNNRKYLDSAFSFPISRTSLISVNLLNGYIQFVIAYTITFIWYAINILPASEKIYFGALWGFFFMSLLYSLFIYSFNSFFFSLCNSTFDGAMVSIAWQFLLCPLALTITEMFGIKWYDQLLLIIWMPLGMMSDHCGNIAKGIKSSPDLGTNYKHALALSLSLLPILIAALCAGTLYFFNRKRAESAGEISDTPVGYKTLIPVCAGMLIYWALELENDNAIISLLALIFTTIGYTIYRRGVRLKAFDIVVIAACFVCFMMGLIA